MDKLAGLQQFSAQNLGLMMVLSLLVGITALVVALDARERGATKISAIIWGLAVQLFLPVAIIYAVVRMLTPPAGGQNRGVMQGPGPSPAQPPAQGGQMFCPYCGVGTAPETKICPGCGRLL